MPYTPPSSSLTFTNTTESTDFRSPFRPLLDGRNGRHNSEPSLILAGHPAPRTSSSSSYIHGHRRSSSIRASVPLFRPRTRGGNDTNAKENAISNGNQHGWQPSQAGPSSLIPSYSVISPPESRQNSSDEDERSKGKVEENMLAGLEAAIMAIEHQTERTPATGVADSPDSISPNSELSLVVADARRKPSSIDILPIRSKSVDGAILRKLPEIEMQTPDQSDHEDDEPAVKSRMIRKKSGELVRPALRMKRRPSSMPGTPTFVKNVHFDAQLEQVRHFLQLDMPVAVSAGSSPVEEYDGDTEFPFRSGSDSKTHYFQWEARITNFPIRELINLNAPVRLERVFLSPDNNYLVGIVTVANLAFQKHVVARFTLDHWKTVSEVEAEYNNAPHAVKTRDLSNNYDRFHFSIRLADLADLESKTMFVCIKYHVNGLEFWDNNGARNYHVNFSKKYKPRHGSGGPAPEPFGTSARTSKNAQRPRPMPPQPNALSFAPARSFQSPRDDGFSRLTEQVHFPYADDDLLEAPTKRTKSAGQAFATRYDFGSSLSAAMQPGNVGALHFGPNASVQDMAGIPGVERVASSAGSSQEAMRPSELLSAKPCHQSPGYKELVDKYCFYETSSSKARSRPGDQKSSADKHHPPARQLSSSPGSPFFSSPDSSSTDEKRSSLLSPRSPRSQSPTHSRSDLGSNTSSSSPIFTHSFHQAIPSGLLSDSPAPTAIRG
ncbi:hypothetical protein D8B26_000261 [Coccidioides posadasii str. Silveira]|uniref:CBM21 domain-containing protein n=1 Tax=Coccidioides posadasii (strain RMSCC 757 / Silveira) TaxID=443226 RepID=E9D851_COCPS|nr:conserved hypothetical protein [Coccidioides posadasii str. Silveira]QVM05554.1 hypothetical protein D8B26_000261 [Coccidioides posadasii str. Silveira]